MMSRLSLARDEGLALETPVGFVNAPGRVDIAGLSPKDIRASTSNAVDHDQLAARGISVGPMQTSTVEASVVFCHRSKAATRDLIARAFEQTRPGGVVAVDGAKTDGIETVLKTLRARFAHVESFSKAHGKLIWTQRPAELPDLEDWKAAPRKLDGFWTCAGVFSAGGIDKGSRLLAQHLPKLAGNGADLGAGWGYLSHHILAQNPTAKLDLIEVDHTALDMARRNITDPRARFHWADALTHHGRYDFIVTNPPFHVSRKADPGLGQRFITKAAELLGPKGDLWMVANRNLPYEASLSETFSKVETRAQEGGFKVIHATRPLRAQGGPERRRLRETM